VARRSLLGVALLACLPAYLGATPAAQAAPCPNETLREIRQLTFLPDCRAYELVSPPAKNGGAVMPNSTRTVAASEGGAVAFSSLAGFGDVEGTAIATDYLAQRSAAAEPGNSGWSTHAISPPTTRPLPLGLSSGVGWEPMDRSYTADLSSSVLQAWGPLSEEPLTEEVPNLYTHTGLRSGASAYSLLSSCPLCESTATPLAPYSQEGGHFEYATVVGVSADGSVVLFESILKLTEGATDGRATGKVNLYESDHGLVRLVDVLPGEVPAESAFAGQGDNAGMGEEQYTPHVLSADGSRAFFTANPGPCSFANHGYAACGDLYLRDRSGPTPQTLQLNESEREPPGPSAPAIYWDAAADGSRAFFTSPSQLTEEPGTGLYMYDLGKPAGERLSLVGPEASAVLGASADGHSVYFTSPEQLVPGEPPITGAPGENHGIFLWTDDPGAPPGGELRFIGQLDNFTLGNNIYNEVSGFPVAFNERDSRVSADGRYFLFSATEGEALLSVRGGADYEQGSCPQTETGVSAPGCREIYLYDAKEDTLVCATCRPDGSVPVASASGWAEQLKGAALSTTRENRALVEGPAGEALVFFSTADPLVSEDTNGKSDAYEYDAATGEVHLISSGASPDDSWFMDASADGAEAFFATSQKLVGWDTDNAYDLYVARSDGGFPEPAAGTEIVCTGEPSCLPAASTPPEPPLGESPVGPPNPPISRHPCPKGRRAVKRHGKVRCVKPKRHHHRRGGGR